MIEDVCIQVVPIGSFLIFISKNFETNVENFAINIKNFEIRAQNLNFIWPLEINCAFNLLNPLISNFYLKD